MTFDELQKIIGKQDQTCWHQHKNGGGWVENSASVDDSAQVCDNALVYGNAQVSGDAWVSGDAQVNE